MNSNQRRQIKRSYYKSSVQQIELENGLYATDMLLKDNDFFLCKFLSRKERKVYTLSVQTLKHQLAEKMLEIAWSHLRIRPEYEGISLFDPILKEMLKKVYNELLTIPEIINNIKLNEYLSSYKEDPFDKKFGYFRLEAVLDKPNINHQDIVNLINNFLNNDELFWSDPAITLTEQYLTPWQDFYA